MIETRTGEFGFLLGYSYVVGEGDPGFGAALTASICSAPFINPVRLVEKQQRAYFKQTGSSKPVAEILSEAAAKNFAPLFRGTIPLMGHSLASAMLGLVGQPRLQKYVQKELGATGSLSGAGAASRGRHALCKDDFHTECNPTNLNQFSDRNHDS